MESQPSERDIALAAARDKRRKIGEGWKRELHEAWHQDTDTLGRLLRAHLAVEHFIGTYLASEYPQLGSSLERARLTYSQKLELLPDDNPILQELRPGLKRLNEIRNKFAHKLNHRLTMGDLKGIATVDWFMAGRQGLPKPGPVSNEPIDIVEDFAHLAASVLQTSSNEARKLMNATPQEERTAGGGGG